MHSSAHTTKALNPLIDGAADLRRMEVSPPTDVRSMYPLYVVCCASVRAQPGARGNARFGVADAGARSASVETFRSHSRKEPLPNNDGRLASSWCHLVGKLARRACARSNSLLSRARKQAADVRPDAHGARACFKRARVSNGARVRRPRTSQGSHRYWGREPLKMTKNFSTMIKYTVPSILYMFCNNLSLEALRYLKPSTYQVRKRMLS